MHVTLRLAQVRRMWARGTRLYRISGNSHLAAADEGTIFYAQPTMTVRKRRLAAANTSKHPI